MLWNIEFKFKARAIPTDDDTVLGWNFAYRPDASGPGVSKWQGFVDAKTGNPPFGSVNFDDLFWYA